MLAPAAPSYPRRSPARLISWTNMNHARQLVNARDAAPSLFASVLFVRPPPSVLAAGTNGRCLSIIHPRRE